MSSHHPSSLVSFTSHWKFSANVSFRTGIISSKQTFLFNSLLRLVTPLSGIPHGTIWEYLKIKWVNQMGYLIMNQWSLYFTHHLRFVLQLRAMPCEVTKPLLWTPMAQILLSPIQTPVCGDRSPDKPCDRQRSITTCSSVWTYHFIPEITAEDKFSLYLNYMRFADDLYAIDFFKDVFLSSNLQPIEIKN